MYMKKIKFVLVFILGLFIFPCMTLAEEAPTPLLEVTGVDLSNGGSFEGASYDPTTKTLSFNNYDGGPVKLGNIENLIINFEGDNTINAEENGISAFNCDVMTIQGSGNVTINAKEEGITVSSGSLLVKDVNATINTEGISIYSMGELEIKNAIINATSKNEYTIANSVGNITFDNPKMTLKGHNGISGSVNTIVKGGTINIESDTSAFGDYGMNLTIDNADINVKSNIGFEGFIKVIINSGNININAVYGIRSSEIEFNGGTTKITSLDEAHGGAVLATYACLTDGCISDNPEDGVIKMADGISILEGYSVVDTKIDNAASKVIGNGTVIYDKDNNNFVNAAKSVTIGKFNTYPLLNGENQTYKLSKDTPLSFRIDFLRN